MLFRSLITNKIEDIVIPAHNHYLLMVDSFCKEIGGNTICNFNLEDDLLKQSMVMTAARLSHKEERVVSISEIAN